MEINWLVLEEEIKRLRDCELMSFNRCGIVEGQFEIVFEKIRFGYVNKDIPFGNELILLWFKILNKAIIELNHNRYAIFIVPDTPYWLEMDMRDDKIFITKLESEVENINFLVTGERKIDLFNKIGIVDIVEKDKFINLVRIRSKEVINFICHINGRLKNSIGIKELSVLIDKAS
jgi:hypothetical protein